VPAKTAGKVSALNRNKMTKKLKLVLVLTVAALALQACSMFKDKQPQYLGSDEGRPLELPEGLDAPRAVSPVVIGTQEMRAPSGDELNPLPPRTANTGGGSDANAYLAWSASGAYLAVKDSPESVARRVRFAIQRSGMHLLERSDLGAHRFEYRHVRVPQEKGFFQKFLFWRNDLGPDYSGSYQVRLEADGDETRVYLILETGGQASTNATEHILGIFMERLG
jgi:uncharacterized lipoprotein